ncbi:MAG: hypothetical protein EPN40_09735 [Rhodanobacteraceae bacterium]|nr:MAG: hypothetical protein EPN40_09735 [Rhodanobacteraceae bacterium]
MRARFTFPTLPLNPVIRVLALAGMVVMLIGLLTVGLVVGAAVLAVAALVVAIRRWRGGRASRPADPSIIEGEFTVVTPRQRAGLPRPE